jgi:hypothetical protein
VAALLARTGAVNGELDPEDELEEMKERPGEPAQPLPYVRIDPTTGKEVLDDQDEPVMAMSSCGGTEYAPDSDHWERVDE